MKPLRLFVLFLLAFGYRSSLYAQTINATQTDEIIIDNGASGKAEPNDRIRYKVTIQNTGGASGTNTQLNIVPDPRTTLVPGTFRSSPLAIADAYACTGNVGLNVPAADGLKANDFDDNLPGASVTAGTFTTTGGGSITISADGSFTYNPVAGFTGSDTYTYTLNDGNAVAGVTATDMAVVTFTISNIIWFVNNTGGGSGGTGTLVNPFKTLADFNAGSATAGDVIYMEEAGTNYTGGIVLQNNERLFGEGHTGGANLANVLPFSLAPNSQALPNINGTSPVITNAGGDGVTLATGNTLRGFNVGDCSGYGFRNSGSLTVGNLSINEVNVNNTSGGGLRILNGGTLAVNFNTFTSMGGVNGVVTSNCGGSFTATSGSISGASGHSFSITGGNCDFSYGGTITKTNSGNVVLVQNRTGGTVNFTGTITATGAATGVSITGSTAANTVNFGTLQLGTSASRLSGGIAINVHNNNQAGAVVNCTNAQIYTTQRTGIKGTSGGSINITNGLINTTGSGATGLDIQFMGINMTFASIDVDNTGGDGLFFGNVTGSLTVTGNTTLGATGNVGGSFGTVLQIQGGSAIFNFSTGAAVFISNVNSAGANALRISGAPTVNFGPTTIGVMGANTQYGVVVEAYSGAGVTFASLTHNATATGLVNMIVATSSGSVSVNGGALTNSNNQPALIIEGNAGTVNMACSITKTGSQGNSVFVDLRTGGTITLSGAISDNSQGILIENNTGGAINFTGTNKSLNTTTNAAVSLLNNTGATINFTNGGLGITTTSGAGFKATGGGTVSVTGSGNTIASTTGTALNVANTTIGANGLTFQSIASNGAVNGILLNATGSNAGLTVTGTGSAGSGGTIQNCTGAGVSLTNTSSVSLTRMNVQGGGDDGINASSVTGFTLADCTVTNNGNSTTDEGIELVNLQGTSSISNCTVTNNAHNNFRLDNSSGTLTSLTVTGSTFEGHNNSTSFGNHGFLFEARLSALVSNVTITNSTFRNNFSIGMQVLTGDNATISGFSVSGCTFSDTGTGNTQEIGADFSTAQTSNMTYEFLNNTLKGHNAQAFNTFTGAGAGTGGSLTATIDGNTIGDQAVIDSGSKSGNGMRINVNGGANAKIKVINNTLHQIPTGRGIECIARNGTGGATFIVTGNNITAPTGTANTGCGAGVLCPLAPIHVQTNCVSICNSACSVVSGNTAYDPIAVPGGLGTEFSVQLMETGASALTYEGNTSLTALQNLTNANPACITKNVSGAVAVVNVNTCPSF